MKNISEKRIVLACQTSGYLLKDIANAFVEGGYSVTIMTSRQSQDTIKGFLPEDVRFCSVISYDKSSSLRRIYTWGVCALQMFFKILFRYRRSEILYVSNPPLSPLIPLFLSNHFSLLIWDIYPDVLVNQGVISKKNIIVKWWKSANRKVFGNANTVFTISTGMKESLSQYVTAEKIRVIPLWPDKSSLQIVNKEDNLFIKDNQLKDKFIVMYSGNLGNTHRMDVLVDVAKKITDEDVLFVLIGEGGKKKMIEERIKKEGVKNVRLLPYQPYEFLSHSLSAADIAVITLDTVSSHMSVPSKTFNMLSLGKPLMCIASPESELGNIVKTYGVGDVFEPEDIDAMAAFIMKLKQDKGERDKIVNNALKASEYFSVENAKQYVI